MRCALKIIISIIRVEFLNEMFEGLKHLPVNMIIISLLYDETYQNNISKKTMHCISLKQEFLKTENIIFLKNVRS